MTCSPHNNPDNYIESPKGNRIVIHCKVCGRFVGYKPTNKKESKKDGSNHKPTAANRRTRTKR